MDTTTTAKEPTVDALRADPLIDAALLADEATAAHKAWLDGPFAKSDWAPNVNRGRALGRAEAKATYRYLLEVAAAGVVITNDHGSIDLENEPALLASIVEHAR